MACAAIDLPVSLGLFSQGEQHFSDQDIVPSAPARPKNPRGDSPAHLLCIREAHLAALLQENDIQYWHADIGCNGLSDMIQVLFSNSLCPP